ncbi:MAG: hypothetical protein ABWZ15_16270 [Acidimicrobiia bacterium]|jgi:hypothetical protein
MTVQPLPEPKCTVCGTAVTLDAARCPSCGLSRPAATGSHVLARGWVWALALVLIVGWALALVVVAGAR